MKNVLYSVLLFVAICGVLAISCTGGDYNASPASNANYVVNPLKPLTSSQFTWGVGATPAIWSGKGVMGAIINGSQWTAANVQWSFDTGITTLIGNVGSQVLHLSLVNVYEGNLYSMGYHQYNQIGEWSDSVSGSYYEYQSVFGNSGEVYITENDSAYIKGMFYFEGITQTGQIVAVNSGYFNFAK